MTLTAHSLGRAVEEGLTYRFHAAWSSVLQLLCVFFEACGRQAHPVMKKVSGGAAGPGQEVALGLLDHDLLEGHVSLLRLHFIHTPYPPSSTPRAHSRCSVLCPQEGDWANMEGTRRGTEPTPHPHALMPAC